MQAKSKVTVLIAEDDDDQRESLVELLRFHGYCAAGAENGREALGFFEQGQPDIMLLDLMMPTMSGWDFLAVRAQDERLRSVPVIILSAACNCEGIADLGISACFEKPLDLESLLDVLQDIAVSVRK